MINKVFNFSVCIWSIFVIQTNSKHFYSSPCVFHFSHCSFLFCVCLCSYHFKSELLQFESVQLHINYLPKHKSQCYFCIQCMLNSSKVFGTSISRIGPISVCKDTLKFKDHTKFINEFCHRIRHLHFSSCVCLCVCEDCFFHSHSLLVVAVGCARKYTYATEIVAIPSQHRNTCNSCIVSLSLSFGLCLENSMNFSRTAILFISHRYQMWTELKPSGRRLFSFRLTDAIKAILSSFPCFLICESNIIMAKAKM